MTLYRYAPEVREIAEEMIQLIEQHQPLQGVPIEYIFRDKAPVSKGRWVLGRARRISGLPAFLSGPRNEKLFDNPRPFFVIEISYNTWVELDDQKRRALVDHELCHCRVTDTDSDEPSLEIRGHDFEEFAAILKRHGLWSSSSERIGAVVAEQLALAIDEITDFVAGLGDTPPSLGRRV